MTKKKHRNHGSHFGKASRPDTKVAVSSQDPGTENSAAAKQAGLSAVKYGAVRGLNNLGNTCFFNSAIQMLQAAPQLQMHFCMPSEEAEVADGPLGEGLRDIFTSSFQHSEGYKFKSDSHNPNKLLSAVCDVAPQFKTEEEKLRKAQSNIMKRAADVEEGLIFRRLSQGSDGDAGKLLADVVDLEGFEDRFRELQMPESNPVFAEDDDENMPESDPIFADDGEGEEKEETKELSGMAFLARTASAKALKRSLSAPAATANKTFVEDTCTPAAAIAKMTAEALMKRTLSAVDRPSRPRRLSLTCDHDRMTSIKENAPEVAAVEGPGNQPEAKEEEVEEEEGPTSLIEAVFGGELSSTVTCDGCRHESITREKFLDLSIPVPCRVSQSAATGPKGPKGIKVAKGAMARGLATAPNSKEAKRLAKEAKKKGKIERRKAHGAKTEFQFEMVLTKDQQAEDELYKEAEEQVGDAKGGAKVGKTEDVPNDVEGDTLEATKEAPGAREAGAEEEGQCQGGEEEAGRGDDIDDVTAAMDALVGCTMEASDDDNGGDPGKLPGWDPDSQEFAIFSEEESSLKVNKGPPVLPKYSALDRDAEMIDQMSGADSVEELSLMGCMAGFFKPEAVEWECPQESGKVGKEEADEKDKEELCGGAAPPAAKQASPGPKLMRRVSFAGSDGEPVTAEPAQPHVRWSLEPPVVVKIPGSEEQRGTDFAKAMKGQATFNKPFKYSGNDFIARVRLDELSYDRLEVLVGPNWDDDAEDMWPEEQKVADVQIDEIPYEEHDNEATQTALQEKAQLLLDCFSQLFMCQGPSGLLNILRAGFVTLEERDVYEGKPPLWVVVGRFPPGQIGGAKQWAFPPDSDASMELFAVSMQANDSPAPSPVLKSPIKNPNFRKNLRSSLKTGRKNQEHEAGMNQAGMKVVGTGRVVMEGLPFISSCHSTSPTIAHFPAKAIYPSIDERAGAPSEEESGDLDEAEDSGVAASKTSVTCDNPVIFDWSSYDGTNAPPGGTLTPFNELCKEAKEGNEDGDADSGLAGKLAAAGKADGAKYVRRQRPEKDNHKEEGAASTTANEAARVVEVAAELEQPADSATRRKGGIKKSVTRKAVKSYKIYRAPELLTVHLKRFQQDMRGRLQKISGSVPFDFNLDLTQFCDPNGPEKDGVRYELVAVVEHSGTLRGGHYVAYARRTAQVPHSPRDERYPPRWHYISDSLVRSVDTDEVAACEAYMLLYVRCP